MSMSSFSAFDNNIVRDTFLVPILDILTGFYAGFAIFTVLGNMYLTKCVESFEEVAAQGPELAFVVYPEGLSLMGSSAPVFSVLFFFMMLALGFGSEFSIMESVISTVIDVFKSYINTAKKVVAARLIICCTFCFFGFFMTSRGGLFVLNLIDSYVAGYPLLIVGICQIVCVCWCYGTDRLIRDTECMIGKKPQWFWNIWIICWKFVCPFVLVALVILTFAIPGTPLNLKGIPYPWYSKVIGNCFVLGPLLSIPGCALYQGYKHNWNWKTLLNPDDSYYDNYRRFLRSQDPLKLSTFDNEAFFNSQAELEGVESKLNSVTAF